MNNQKRNKIYTARRLALCSILCAAALVIFIVEAQIPALVPVPGVKLGLANIITLFALIYLTPAETFMILIARILLGSVFAAQPMLIPYSLCGGILCLLGEYVLIKLFGKKFIAEISVIGAILHNIGQICFAAAAVKSASVFAYLPVLIISAAITGLFCGLCVMLADKACGKKFAEFLKKQPKTPI